tara:strand:+ start:2641 stop:3117 length:477 start_codon:yes stop_codon:yes gene_type:complete
MKNRMITLNLAGITFLDKSVNDYCLSGQIKPTQEVSVNCTKNSGDLYESDFSITTKVNDTDIHIGWVPKLHTIMKYMNQSYKSKDNERYIREQQRYDLALLLRGNIYTDLFRNNISPKGIIDMVLLTDKTGKEFYKELEPDKELKLASISVTFNYPNP